VTSPYQATNTPADPRHSSRLGFFQRFYLVEVLQGLKLTGIRFFANMWRHTLHTVFGVKSAHGAVTSLPARSLKPQAGGKGICVPNLARLTAPTSAMSRPYGMRLGPTSPRLP